MTPVIVPFITVPFLSSTVTVSFWHFIKNLKRDRCADDSRVHEIGLFAAQTHLTSFTIVDGRLSDLMTGCC